MALQKSNSVPKDYTDVAGWEPQVKTLVKDSGQRVDARVDFGLAGYCAQEQAEMKGNMQLVAFPQDVAYHPAADCKKEYQDKPAEETLFTSELRRLLNSRNMESASNTPDHILAKYLLNSLAAFNAATRERERWYGRKVF